MASSPAKRSEAPVILIGPMAAGKTHVGSVLAEQAGRPFVDADRLIVNRYGPIPEIFRQGGEEQFRRIESEVILEVLANPLYAGSVFSLGGGAPMHPEVRAALAEHTVIYLRIDVETVRPRIANRSDRPMIADDPVRRWEEILVERAPVYQALADVVLDVSGGGTPEGTVEQIRALLPSLFPEIGRAHV